MQMRFITIVFFTITYNDCGHGFQLLNKTIDNKWISDSLNIVIELVKKLVPQSTRGRIPMIPLNYEYDEIAKYLISSYHASLEENIEATKNITELVLTNGFKIEKHEVETEDGYILGLFRIPGNGSTIFLMHGILLSADDWVTAGREIGLAYLLVERGFDVWMGNARGTKHSRRHKALSPDTAEFWDFSYYEIGIYDVPSMIDYALNSTNKSQLIYAGHSQGCTNFFVMCSEKLEYNSKISLMIALAPVAAVPHIQTPLLLLVNLLTLYHPQYVYNTLRNIGYYEFLSSVGFVPFITVTFCTNQIFQPFCNAALYFAAGFDYSQKKYTTLGTVYAHIPAGASTKQLEHYAQSVPHGKFSKFDYGRVRNIIKYGSASPPEFPIEKITTPIAIFYGRNDRLATVADIFVLRRKLRSVVNAYEIPYLNFDHLDFVYAKDFEELVFSEIMKLVNT